MPLVVQYKMQDRLPTRQVLDSSGNGLHGELSVNTDTISEDGNWGTAIPRFLHFNGVDNEMVMPGLASYMGDNFTVAVWLDCDSASPAESASGLMHLGVNVPNQAGHYPYPGFGGYFPYARGVNNTTVDRVNNVSLAGGATRTNPHHLAITSTPGANGWKLWSNGVVIHQTTGLSSLYWDDDVWSFGRSAGALLSYWFDGGAADLRIYNSVENVPAIVAEKDLGGHNISSPVLPGYFSPVTPPVHLLQALGIV